MKTTSISGSVRSGKTIPSQRSQAMAMKSKCALCNYKACLEALWCPPLCLAVGVEPSCRGSSPRWGRARLSQIWRERPFAVLALSFYGLYDLGRRLADALHVLEDQF